MCTSQVDIQSAASVATEGGFFLCDMHFKCQYNVFLQRISVFDSYRIMQNNYAVPGAYLGIVSWEYC